MNLTRVTIFAASYSYIALMIVSIIGVVFLLNRSVVVPPAQPVPVVVNDNAEDPAAHEAAVAQAKVEVTAIADKEVWHASNDTNAIQGIGHHHVLLQARTGSIRDSGIRNAGHAFLAAIHQTKSASGEIVYTADAAAIAAIDPATLKRWATIALTVLQIAEPFVPPPYNVAVHAAVMLLELYLANPEPAPAVFSPRVSG